MNDWGEAMSDQKHSWGDEEDQDDSRVVEVEQEAHEESSSEEVLETEIITIRRRPILVYVGVAEDDGIGRFIVDLRGDLRRKV